MLFKMAPQPKNKSRNDKRRSSGGSSSSDSDSDSDQIASEQKKKTSIEQSQPQAPTRLSEGKPEPPKRLSGNADQPLPLRPFAEQPQPETPKRASVEPPEPPKRSLAEPPQPEPPKRSSAEPKKLSGVSEQSPRKSSLDDPNPTPTVPHRKSSGAPKPIGVSDGSQTPPVLFHPRLQSVDTQTPHPKVNMAMGPASYNDAPPPYPGSPVSMSVGSPSSANSTTSHQYQYERQQTYYVVNPPVMGTSYVAGPMFYPQPVPVYGGGIQRCPNCHAGVLTTRFDMLGILLAIFFFPFGLICCLLMQHEECTVCGACYQL